MKHVATVFNIHSCVRRAVFKDSLLTVARQSEMNPNKTVLFSTENNMQLSRNETKTQSFAPYSPATDGEYQSKQLYCPRKHIPLCQAPYAFII